MGPRRPLRPKSSSAPSRSPRWWYLLASFLLALSLFYLLQHSGHIHVPHRTTRARYTAGARKPIVHPIPKLMKDAEEKFAKMIEGQSKSLGEAVAEYKRRYGRSPPLGFDEWYKFAVDNDVVIIDEYDQLIEDLRPFWLLTGKEIRRRSIQIGGLPSVDLVRVEGGKTSTVNANTGFADAEGGARAKGFRIMMERFQARLPDMDFPINEKAEGRILVPWEQTKFANLTVDSSKGIEAVLGGEFVPDWHGDGGSVWQAFRKTCPPNAQARRLFGSVRNALRQDQVIVNHLAAAGVAPKAQNEDFNFPAGVDDRYNYCDHPWAHMDQGHFFSDWRTIHALYPMFSPAKGLGFSDILIPSHYYHQSSKKYTYGWDPVNMKIKEIDEMETPWEKKSNKIYWRGATTGGGSSPPGAVARYQRHRFVRMTSDLTLNNRTVVFAHPSRSSSSSSSSSSPASPTWVEAPIPMRHLNDRIMDVAFVKAVGCTQYPLGGCDGMRRDHRFADPVRLGENWRHKYLIDIDGMGYSARLMALLMSESAVMKATVYRDFFSDWIMPWLHFIPISANYQEIYNVHAYFSGPTPEMTAAVSPSSSSSNSTFPPPRIPRSRSPTRADSASPPRKPKPKAYDDWELRKIASEGRKWKMTHGRKIDMEVYVYRLCLEWARLVADDREGRTFKG